MTLGVCEQGPFLIAYLISPPYKPMGMQKYLMPIRSTLIGGQMQVKKWSHAEQEQLWQNSEYLLNYSQTPRTHWTWPSMHRAKCIQILYISFCPAIILSPKCLFTLVAFQCVFKTKKHTSLFLLFRISPVHSFFDCTAVKLADLHTFLSYRIKNMRACIFYTTFFLFDRYSIISTVCIANLRFAQE